MSVTLYDATVKNFLRQLGAMQGVFDLGMEHCKQNSIDPGDLVEARIFSDMLPLRFQAQSIYAHSAGAIAGAMAGVFSPLRDVDLPGYSDLCAFIAKAADELEKVKPEDVNALEGKDVVFQIGEMKMPFKAEDFLLSFSVPNFYFHATTAYDLLRMHGVPLGKRNFLGSLPTKTG